MKNTSKIIIVGKNYLITSGLQSLIAENKMFHCNGAFTDELSALDFLKSEETDIVIIDLSTINYSTEFISSIKSIEPLIQILVFNSQQSKQFISQVLENGVTSYLMLHCDKDEITDAIKKTIQGERFLCGHVVEVLIASHRSSKTTGSNPSAYCGGLTISEREMEIIKLIAEGHSNQEIADKLFISVHTVTTHRKNIMGKLGLCNTAGLVMYAIKEQIISVH